MSISQPIPHHRKQFQVDRICFFSDAIMAIAITLLILEFKVPSLGKDRTWQEIRPLYGSRIFVPAGAMLLSFAAIRNLWIQHHELFEYVVNYNEKLIKYNFRFLLLVIILPLTTSFMLQSDNPWFLRFFFYFANLGFCNFYFFLLYRAVHNKKNQLSSQHPELIGAVNRKNYFISMIAFFGAAIGSLFSREHFYFPLFFTCDPCSCPTISASHREIQKNRGNGINSTWLSQEFPEKPFPLRVDIKNVIFDRKMNLFS